MVIKTLFAHLWFQMKLLSRKFIWEWKEPRLPQSQKIHIKPRVHGGFWCPCEEFDSEDKVSWWKGFCLQLKDSGMEWIMECAQECSNVWSPDIILHGWFAHAHISKCTLAAKLHWSPDIIVQRRTRTWFTLTSQWNAPMSGILTSSCIVCFAQQLAL